jgi:hypothetical protein
MNLRQLAREFNPQLEELPDSELTKQKCIGVIRDNISGATSLTNFQLLILAYISSNKSEFQEKVLFDFINRTSN